MQDDGFIILRADNLWPKISHSFALLENKFAYIYCWKFAFCLRTQFWATSPSNISPKLPGDYNFMYRSWGASSRFSWSTKIARCERPSREAEATHPGGSRSAEKAATLSIMMRGAGICGERKRSMQQQANLLLPLGHSKCTPGFEPPKSRDPIIGRHLAVRNRVFTRRAALKCDELEGQMGGRPRGEVVKKAAWGFPHSGKCQRLWRQS